MKRLIAAFGLAAVLAGPAYADGTINTLTAGSALGGTEQIPMFQGANPAVTTTPNAIKTFTNAGVNHPLYQSTIWYAPRISGQASSGGPALTTAYCSIAQIGGGSAVSVTALAMRTTANAGNIQLALYNNDTSSGISRPGTLVGATANIVATTLGNLSGSLASGPFSVNPGFYWFCMETDNTALRYPYVASGTLDLTQVSISGSATLANAIGATPIVGISTTTGVVSFGTWPSFVGATFTEVTNTAPIVAFQVQ